MSFLDPTQPNVEDSGYAPPGEEFTDGDLGAIAETPSQDYPMAPETGTGPETGAAVGTAPSNPGNSAAPPADGTSAAESVDPMADFHPSVRDNPASAPDPGYTPTRTVADATTGRFLDYVEQRFADYGWGPQELPALIGLWNETSSGYTQSHTGTAHWDPDAENLLNGASGIPGLLPDTVETLGEPMRWDDPFHQIDVGLEYIKGKYKTPTAAWNTMRLQNWY